MYIKKERSTPCIECRNQRRKCIRSSLDADCLRCEKLGEACQQPTQSGEEHKDFDALKNQVNQLEKAVAFMEEQLQIHHNYDSSSYSNYDGTLVRSEKQPLPEVSNRMIQSLFHTWKVKIQNGTFQIETGIQNISELLQFHPSITYLSPLSQYYTSESSTTAPWSSNGSSYSDDNSSDFYRGCNAGIVMRFGREGIASLIPSTIKILTRCMKTRLVNSPATNTITLPNALLLDPKALVNQLLDIYFECHNKYNPLVHEPTHRAKLATIEDPLTDLVTLGICSYVCSAACKHLQLPLKERRTMGDYFHAKARSIIMDQFDQPEKRLENVMGINLLIEYMHMTFKFDECRQLLAMAFQILLDLRNDYPEFRTIGVNACFEGGPHSGYYTFTKCEGPITDVNKMLFTRHVTISLWFNLLMDYMADDIADSECLHFPIWKYMADEPEETKRSVQAQNWAINLYNHPFVMNFSKQTLRVLMGRTCTLSLESIVKLETVLREWAMALPAEFRLCNNLYDKEACYEAIDQTTDSVVLITFIHFHIFHVSIYSCLLQPKSLHGESQQPLLSWVQEHSLKKALRSCQLALYAIHRLTMAETNSCSYKLCASEFLFSALDVLALLALSPNMHIAKEARPIMRSCLNELDTNLLSIRFRVQSNYSKGPTTFNLSELLNGGKFDVDYYDQFPHPWLEMMYDASRYITAE
ncbi:uncharacterized protein ATC70_011346 [Mucor velutinosus]|uniref:Zn(2)-C6 fungal-type domain-containing protein n=1 Tax=Mucor velutinosus TaxID=708070 RepID=A0AAN7DKL0_9FUNG|nr:hypothetical protein ATC70_011346 [Mucor velutinosus]